MRIIHNLGEMTETARGWLAGGSVGFVPTMGFLHAGHMSLVQAAKQDCEISVVSIFVNPIQFDAQEDLVRYPRDLERDLRLLDDINIDVVFIPRAEDIFPPDFSTYVVPSGPIMKRLESLSSPVYIRGVATVITKLFQLVRPDVAYFGQKDAQKIAIVRKLVQDLNIDVTLRILPTVRESDGLALTSQNYLLSPSERQAVQGLYRALLAAKSLVEQGERRPHVVSQAMTDIINGEPLLTLNYAVVCHPDTFNPINVIQPGTVLALAASVGSIRLVDNITWLENGQWLL
ncbi:MAG: pantoate--beta-alanine ligase [Ktedonobacteraceae bacterium]